MNLNKLASFIADVGYNEAENLLGLDADLLLKAVSGDTLSRYENALIDNAYSKLELYETDYIDFDYIDETAENLDFVLIQTDTDSANELREAFANGQFDLETFNDYGWKMFPNLSSKQIGMLADWLIEDSNHLASEFLDRYYADGFDIWADVTESEFWEWFRTVFYE